MKKLAFLAVAMFAIVLALGCGSKPADTGTGTGYTLTVSPTDMITGGTATIDLRLENIFDKDMKNVKVWLKDISHNAYQISGEQDTTRIPSILAKQTYPVIMTLSSNTPGEISGKHIEVCFDYDTEYYFDVGLKSKTNAAELLSVQSGASSGPLTMSATGFDNVFYENAVGTGALTLTNNWDGKIKSINSITATFPVGTYVKNGTIAISTCSDSAASSTDKIATLASTTAGCTSILTNEVAIANGLTLRTEVGADTTQKTSTVERVLGTVAYTYCYDIEMPAITIKSV